jgi:hypothetical protein
MFLVGYHVFNFIFMSQFQVLFLLCFIINLFCSSYCIFLKHKFQIDMYLFETCAPKKTMKPSHPKHAPLRTHAQISFILFYLHTFQQTSNMMLLNSLNPFAYFLKVHVLVGLIIVG